MPEFNLNEYHYLATDRWDCVAPDLPPVLLATPRPSSLKIEERSYYQTSSKATAATANRAIQAKGGLSYNAVVFILIPFNRCHHSFLQ